MMPRPELQAPPEIFYNDIEARKYTTSSRIIEIQAKISERALELLNLPNNGVPQLLLDIGCGSGLSGETLSENGHQWIGYDISKSMLNIALEREVEGDLMLADMGQGLGLRTGVIDGAISISAIQILVEGRPPIKTKSIHPYIHESLRQAVLQLYSENMSQSEMIMKAAMRAGFAGGVVVDYPHSTKARKAYLVLTCGPPSMQSSLPKGKGEDGETYSEDDESDDNDSQSVGVYNRHRPAKRSKITKKGKDMAWLRKKKEQRRKKGHAVPPDTKYTGRKRKVRF